MNTSFHVHFSGSDKYYHQRQHHHHHFARYTPGNPLEQKHSEEGNWVAQVQQRLPNLKKMDGKKRTGPVGHRHELTACLFRVYLSVS